MAGRAEIVAQTASQAVYTRGEVSEMLLYDIYYDDGSYDADRPLPEFPTEGTSYAACTNGPTEVLVPSESGEWVKVYTLTSPQLGG
jgi:hypothetical protein